jgi:hypothetical protein
MMSTYTAPIRDMQFNSSELVDLSAIAGPARSRGSHARHWSMPCWRRPASSRAGVLDPLNKPGDRIGAKLEPRPGHDRAGVQGTPTGSS